MQKISIIIPCHNEEAGIGHVLADIPQDRLKQYGYESEVIVIDNNSTDKTAAVAASYGAKVIREKKRGKGKAIQAGFRAVSDDTTFVVMMDGDHTYKPQEILRMIEPLASGFCDVVVGSRLNGKLRDPAFTFSRRVANWAFTFFVRQMFKANITDVLSGYFAWKKEVVDQMKQYISADGFAIEMDMITKMVKLGYEIYSVPITYEERKGHSKIQSVQDGMKIGKMFVSNLTWQPLGANSSRTKSSPAGEKSQTFGNLEL